MDKPGTLTAFQPKPTGTVLEHDRQLFAARFSPCGRFLVAGSYDATIERWDFRGETPVRMKPCVGHSAWVQQFAFIPGTEQLASADSWGTLIVHAFTGDDPEKVWTRESAHDGWIRALCVSPDGQFLATGGNDLTIKVWNASDGTLVRSWPHPDKVFSLGFAPDGGTLYSGGLKGIIRIWDQQAGTQLHEVDTGILYKHDRIQECGGVRLISFSADGKQFACAGQKNPGGGFSTGVPCILVYDTATRELLREMAVGANDDGFAYDAVFHPAGFVMGTSCAFPGKGSVWFWQAGADKPFYESKAIPNGRSLSLHPSSDRLALLVSQSPNGNGRQLVNGKYAGGSARIHILSLTKPA